ncbi:hypothetical protein NEMIN01_2347, partial [Nematocida minor]|uniref:uncharacterized protein n=1 Tax=Nematocida minor TaxID=1912983 RepID=UPI00221FF02E
MLYSLEKREMSGHAQTLTSKARLLLYKCPVVFFGAVLYLMYVMTVGEKMFFSEGSFAGASLHITSTVLFVISSCVSQVLFFLLSSYTAGVVSSPISESFKNVQAMHASLAGDVGPDRMFTNLFLCMALATLFTSAGFFAMYALRAERVIKRIPSGMSKALFVSIGFLCVSYANERIGDIQVAVGAKWLVPALFNAAGVSITVLCWACEGSFPAVARYSVLWVAALFTAGFYTWAWTSGENTASLLAKKWLLTDPRKTVALKVPPLVFAHVQTGAVLKQLPNIAKIAVLNILQFPINFPPTASQ